MPLIILTLCLLSALPLGWAADLDPDAVVSAGNAVLRDQHPSNLNALLHQSHRLLQTTQPSWRELRGSLPPAPSRWPSYLKPGKRPPPNVAALVGFVQQLIARADPVFLKIAAITLCVVDADLLREHGCALLCALLQAGAAGQHDAAALAPFYVKIADRLPRDCPGSAELLGAFFTDVWQPALDKSATGPLVQDWVRILTRSDPEQVRALIHTLRESRAPQIWVQHAFYAIVVALDVHGGADLAASFEWLGLDAEQAGDFLAMFVVNAVQYDMDSLVTRLVERCLVQLADAEDRSVFGGTFAPGVILAIRAPVSLIE